MKSLRAVRKELKMSLAFLAGKARVSYSLVNYAELGRYQLTKAQAGKIASALGIEASAVRELRAADETETAEGRD